MPCYYTGCNTLYEVFRFAVSVLAIYAYHYVWDHFVFVPIVNRLHRAKLLKREKFAKMRESLWKAVVITSFVIFNLLVAGKHSWWMNAGEYFTDWPYVAPEDLRWYYMLYFAFWLQSIDFLLNITSKHYVIKRKDNPAMLLHHGCTMALMIISYFLDFTKIGSCVLLIHDISDILLETAKVFVYTGHDAVVNIIFASFAASWYILRWGIYSYNILYSVYTEAHYSILSNPKLVERLANNDVSTWHHIWIVFLILLSSLLVLHVYWGVLIARMVLKAMNAGNVEKDIRSDSESEESCDLLHKEKHHDAIQKKLSDAESIRKRKSIQS